MNEYKFINAEKLAIEIKTILQDQIENEIANLLLAGDLKRRDAVLINDNGQVEIQHGREL